MTNLTKLIFLLWSFLILLASCKVRKLADSHQHKLNIELDGLNISTKLKREVNTWLGVPYKYGGRDKNTIDCSGLICELYRAVYGIQIAKTVKLQYEACTKIATRKLHEGDLVFFNPETKEVTHVGLYLCDHKFVHASVSKGVVISSLENLYYKKYFIGAGRLHK